MPDTTLHYVPFTYAGTVDAYKLISEMATTVGYATQNKYPHSLFVADYPVTHTVSWDELNTAGLIFGRSYTGGSVDYTLRAPSGGSGHTGSGDSERGTPQSNEWDAVLDKNSGYIKNWGYMYSWGQDTLSGYSVTRAVRGFTSARHFYNNHATSRHEHAGFRPVLEVLNTDELGPDGLKAVTLDLNGGKLGGSTENIQIVVKNGAAFTAPASDGLTAPQVGYSAQWQDSDGNLYAPGDSVPAGVTTLTAQWTPDTYTITYDGGDSEGSIPADVKTHGEDLTLRGETFTWDGYVQTGWVDKETGAIYDLGATYDEDRDATLYPYWEKLITVTAGFTTTVELSDVGVPGEKTFTLALIGDSAPNLDKSDVSITGSVTTNGKGSYNGTLTFTGPEGTLWVMLSEGAFVQQVDDGEAGWTVDDTVWGVLMEEIPVAYAMGDDATASGYTVYVVPASVDGNGYYYIDWENLQTADMRFTNTYSAHVYELKHDATHHWDECQCKDVQNKELHKYGDWTVKKEATEQEAGEKEHTCTVCGYTETAEIEKLPANPGTDTEPGTDTPATGDNGHMALWIALLFVGGAGVIGTTVYGKKKRAK